MVELGGMAARQSWTLLYRHCAAQKSARRGVWEKGHDQICILQVMTQVLGNSGVSLKLWAWLHRYQHGKPGASFPWVQT